MTKDDMEQLRVLDKEIRAIEESLENPKSTYVTAFYKDYRTGKGIPKSESGYDYGEEEYEKLQCKLKVKKSALRKMIEDAEEFIAGTQGSEMRTILRMYYVNGNSQEEIGKALKYDHSVISRKIKIFWQNTTCTKNTK